MTNRNLRRQFRTLGILPLTLALVVACSSSDDTTPEMETEPSPLNEQVPAVGNSAIGSVYTAGENQLTVYTFEGVNQDPAGCDEACENLWPPVLTEAEVPAINGAFEVFTRADGNNQWMFKGSPLYYYVVDTMAGDVTGEGLGAQWYVARPDPVTSANTTLGETLVVSGSVANATGNQSARDAHDGRSLYFFTEDIPGSSNCSGTCVTNWPPLYADAAARGFNRLTVFDRTDGARQWAYDNKPLYRYIGDNQPGDITGAGVNASWILAAP